MIQGILFDLDGTLIGPKTKEDQALIAFYKKYQEQLKDKSFDAFLKVWSMKGRENLKEFVEGRISFEEKITNQIFATFQEFNHPINEIEAKVIFNEFLPIYEEQIILYDDVIPCLTSLKKQDYPLGILSNGFSSDQKKKIKRFNLEPFFDHITISGDYSVAKPNPEIFQICINKFELLPSEIVYIGDNVEWDLLPALALGMEAIWMNRFDRKTIEDINTIKSLNELLNSIDNLR
ncbi:MAG: HAD family hydrolase [Candidatus Thorarchaeota archaeon]